MSLTLNLDKSVEALLKENNLPPPTAPGGRRKRGGADEEEAKDNAAKITLIGILKKAKEIGYDVAVKGAQAAGYVGAAALVLYVADQSFKPNLCDPLTLSLSRAISMIPSAAGYAATCDSAAAAYNAAISTAALTVSPLVIMALKKAASIVVPETVVDEVGDAIITAIRDPKSAAENAIMTRSRARKAARAAAPEPEEEEVTPIIPPMTGRISKRRGGKKTKKRVTKKRKTTRRSAFSY
jgi:hypothetical protein